MWKNVKINLLLVTAMAFSMSVFAEDVSVRTSTEPSYVMYAGLSDSIKAYGIL